MKEKIEQIINDAKIESGLLKLTSSKGNSYFTSYPYFIRFFKKFNKEFSNEKDIEELLYQGANMVYGWMPTILDTQKKKDHYKGIDKVYSSIVSLDDAIDQEHLKVVSSFMNNSIVGASKLLHFIYPKKYPIWDSKICGHLLDTQGASSQVKKIENYIRYYKAIKNITDHQTKEKLSMFKEIFKNEKLGEISTVRAAELIIFLDAQTAQARIKQQKS
tara:strand:+ start:131 stop:781 length:651 start_codon:yes stop_codon:yes gene_type:complete